MSDPNNECNRSSTVGAALKQAQIIQLSKSGYLTNSTLGIELPLGWYLVKGEMLRRLQAELHEAQQTAALRLRICANLQGKLLRKDVQ